jgi:hypothetical protein
MVPSARLGERPAFSGGPHRAETLQEETVDGIPVGLFDQRESKYTSISSYGLDLSGALLMVAAGFWSM